MSRIVLVCPSMQFGGAERLVVDLAAQLAGQHHAVAIAAPAGPLDAEVAPGVERLVLDEAGRSPVGSARNAARLARFARRFGADVLHGHNVKATAVAAAAARLSGRRPRPPVAATFHGVAHAEYRPAARLLRGADRVACVSADLLDRLVAAGHPPDRLTVIPNAVGVAPPGDRAALDAELGLGDAPLVAIVGRLVAQKAHEHFLAAMAELARAVPEARALVVGDGPRRAELEALAADRGLSGRVTFTGARRDARELIARADVLVFSSHWEGLSIAALEALAAGTPVVSTDVEGMRELLGGGAGRLVPPADPGALAAAVADVLRSPELRAEMGAAGRDLVARRYAPAAMRDAYLELYRDAAARVSGP